MSVPTKLSTIALLLSASCHPKIGSFQVTPAAYCPGSPRPIHIEWKTSNGKTTLQVEPDDHAPSDVGDEGHRDLPPHDMVVTLTVSKGDLHPHVIMPVRAVARRPLTDRATHCANGWVSTEGAAFGGGSRTFDPQAHPSIISNKCRPGDGRHATCRRNVIVVHDGHKWSLAPDSTLDVSKDAASPTGTWVLEEQLLPDEKCGTQSAIGAEVVDLEVEIGCTKGASYEQR